MGEPTIPAKIHPDSVPYVILGTYPRHMVEREGNSVASITIWSVRLPLRFILFFFMVI